MKNYNDDSNKNLINTLLNDAIERREGVFDLINLLYTINDNRIIAINGSWGSGKTFFVKHLELLINFINNYDLKGKLINPEINTNKLKCLKELTKKNITEINKLLEEKEYKKTRELFGAGNRMNCVYFNAWEYDDNEEPILSIVYKILKDFSYLKIHTKQNKIKLGKILDSIVSYFVKRKVSPSELVESTNFIEEIQTVENIKEKCNELFEELLIENADKMVIIIDELDRCKPIYAIKLLEQIKHYIKSNNIIILLTMNMKQLSCAIKNLYGYDFDSEEYLEKIIDLILSLKPVDKKAYLNSLFEEAKFNTREYHTLTILDYINYKNINMREINRYLSVMMIYENIQRDAFVSLNFYKIFRYVFLPYYIGQQMFDYKKFEEFTNGKGFDDFFEYIESSNIVFNITKNSLKLNDESSNNRREYMKQVYDATYNTHAIQNVARTINGEEFTMNDIKNYNELCSVLKSFNLNF